MDMSTTVLKFVKRVYYHAYDSYSVISYYNCILFCFPIVFVFRLSEKDTLLLIE